MCSRSAPMADRQWRSWCGWPCSDHSRPLEPPGSPFALENVRQLVVRGHRRAGLDPAAGGGEGTPLNLVSVSPLIARPPTAAWSALSPTASHGFSDAAGCGRRQGPFTAGGPQQADRFASSAAGRSDRHSGPSAARGPVVQAIPTVRTRGSDRWRSRRRTAVPSGRSVRPCARQTQRRHDHTDRVGKALCYHAPVLNASSRTRPHARCSCSRRRSRRISWLNCRHSRICCRRFGHQD